MKAFVTWLMPLCVITMNVYADPSITIRIDTYPAETVLKFLEEGKWNASVANDLVNHIAVKEQLQHNSQFDDGISRDSYLESLKQATLGTPMDKDPIRLQKVKTYQKEIRQILSRVSSSPEETSNRIADLIRNNVPDNLVLNSTVYLMTGSNSCGWTIGAERFYVDLRCIRDDYDGLILLSAHELYHVAQASFMNTGNTDKDLIRFNQNTESILSR